MAIRPWKDRLLNRCSVPVIQLDNLSWLFRRVATNRTSRHELEGTKTTAPALAVNLATLWALRARLTLSRASPLAPPHYAALSQRSGEGIEATLHRFAEKEVISRWDLEDQFVALAAEPHLGQKIDQSAA